MGFGLLADRARGDEPGDVRWKSVPIILMFQSFPSAISVIVSRCWCRMVVLQDLRGHGYWYYDSITIVEITVDRQGKFPPISLEEDEEGCRW
jgi:hypothetical protein